MKRLLIVVIMLLFVLPVVPEAFADDAKTLEKALTYYHSGHFKNSAELMREYVKTKPEPAAYYILGYSLYKLKKFDEASEYFSQAYLIDPAFVPEKSGMPKQPAARKAKHRQRKAVTAPVPEEKAGLSTKEPMKQETKKAAAPEKKAQPATDTKVAPQGTPVKPAAKPLSQVAAAKPVPQPSPQAAAKPVPQPSPRAAAKPTQPQAPAAAAKTATQPSAPAAAAKPATQPSAPAVAGKPATQDSPQAKAVPSPAQAPSQAATQKPEPQQVTPQPVVPPAPAVPPVMPRPVPTIPSAAPMLVTGLFAGVGIFMLVISLVFYLYWSYCLFLIATKRNVSPAWTAWIPIVQIWTIVASAGKPWWWIILLFVPIVNFFVAIYLWMCITEALGKNKWLGLLMIVPLINLIFLGMLAFSKTETSGKV